MGKRYVDMEQLEQLFAEYAIPYTNIFDELEQISTEDVVKGMPLVDLKATLESRSDVVASQVWSREDIHAAIRSAKMKTGTETVPESSDFIDRVAAKAAPVLENCTDNWDRIHAAIRECMLEEDKK